MFGPRLSLLLSIPLEPLGAEYGYGDDNCAALADAGVVDG